MKFLLSTLFLLISVSSFADIEIITPSGFKKIKLSNDKSTVINSEGIHISLEEGGQRIISKKELDHLGLSAKEMLDLIREFNNSSDKLLTLGRDLEDRLYIGVRDDGRVHKSASRSDVKDTSSSPSSASR